ncbi:MAG TPA: ABC transporter substrate-binding protein [Ilumatobacteraceae bacterium]|nr:ABC transporter substrate-binding protein [Ilumatobacteraceae bacterium]
MGRRRLAPVLSLAVVGSLILGACGDDDTDSADTDDTTGSADTAAPDGTTADDGGDTGGDTGGDKPTIVLVQNAWTASAINVAIAKQLIEENLGNPVEVTSIDENTMFAGLSNGDADAVLEFWPSGLSEDEQKYFDDGTVVEIGELGAIGRIGWYVPDYVLEEYPELATWEGFKDPEVAKAFATAETGDNGRFLGTDPSYSQADEAIITNLELPYQVVYSGSEAATIAELDSKVAAGEPIVMYWWAPTAAAGKYNLQKVELPPYTDECYADPAAIDCDYPEDVLVKLASSGLEAKDPAVFAFLQNFQISTEDQLAMLPPAEIDGVPAADVAAEWIAANEATWQAWL